MYTLGSRVGIIYILGALGNAWILRRCPKIGPLTCGNLRRSHASAGNLRPTVLHVFLAYTVGLSREWHTPKCKVLILAKFIHSPRALSFGSPMLLYQPKPAFSLQVSNRTTFTTLSCDGRRLCPQEAQKPSSQG